MLQHLGPQLLCDAAYLFERLPHRLLRVSHLSHALVRVGPIH